MFACACCNRPLILNETYQFCERGLFWTSEAPYRLIDKELLTEFTETQKRYIAILNKMGTQVLERRNAALKKLEEDKDSPRVLPVEHQVLTATLAKGTSAEEYSQEARDEAKEMRNEKEVPEGMYT